MTGIDPVAGFNLTTLDERLTEVGSAWQGVFGANVNIDPDTIDGQIIGIFGESWNNLDMLAEAVFAAWNPQSATGSALARLVQLNAITKIGGSATQVPVINITDGQAAVTVVAGTLLTSSTGTQIETLADVILDGNGNGVAAGKATSFGALQVLAGALTLSSPAYGLADAVFTVPTAATPGVAEETDEALRIRRAQSTATSSQSLVDSMYGQLSNLAGVTQVVVLENASSTTNADGMPPHSIYCIVEGGTASQIGQIIWQYKSLGVTTYGNTAVQITDSQGFTHTVYYDPPTNVQLYVVVNVKLATLPTNGITAIQTALVNDAANFTIGETVVQGQLYTPVNAAVPGLSIRSIQIGTSANPTGTSDVVVAFNQLPVITAANVVVNAT